MQVFIMRASFTHNWKIMRPHLEQGDAVGMIVAGPEEDHLAVRAVLQLLPDQLNQLFLT